MLFIYISTTNEVAGYCELDRFISLEATHNIERELLPFGWMRNPSNVTTGMNVLHVRWCGQTAISSKTWENKFNPLAQTTLVRQRDGMELDEVLGAALEQQLLGHPITHDLTGRDRVPRAPGAPASPPRKRRSSPSPFRKRRSPSPYAAGGTGGAGGRRSPSPYPGSPRRSRSISPFRRSPSRRRSPVRDEMKRGGRDDDLARDVESIRMGFGSMFDTRDLYLSSALDAALHLPLDAQLAFYRQLMFLLASKVPNPHNGHPSRHRSRSPRRPVDSAGARRPSSSSYDVRHLLHIALLILSICCCSLTTSSSTRILTQTRAT